ncbi:signal peptidase I [Burkholderia sp. MBR-1]|uniref:signal peptidase I n=1 Tax=Burkholderia sp. MBR-1 TaxID=2732364 RepID=UPI00215D742C|nr:signal peptidase I [Burkholderia sp. MBR-1]
MTLAGALSFGAFSLAVHAGIVPQLYFEAQDVACLPWDVYVPASGPGTVIHHGDIVRFRARGLAPLFKDGTPMAKMAVGLPGDRISVHEDRVYVNGKYWGSLAIGLRRLQKPPGYWDRDLTVGKGEIFVLGTEPRSFDSRYWGVIHEDQVDGTLSVLL